MRWKIITTERFRKEAVRLDYSVRKRIINEVEQLKENLFRGKPLGYNFLREKKVKGYRFYYLIFKEEVLVLVTSISNKKSQQGVINEIKKLLPYYVKRISDGLFDF